MDTDTTRLGGGHAPAVSEIVDGLNDLLQLDHDAIGAYDIAIEKLEDRDHATQILGYRRDHERHIQELNTLIASLGGQAKNEPHFTGPFKAGLQSLAGLGGDRGLLVAFRANELQVRAKYDTYAARANQWPAQVKRVIDQAALDEERHYRWVADTLQSMGVGMGEGPEIDAATKAREHTLLHGDALDNARERVVEVAGQARERIVDVAGQARERLSGVAESASGLAETARERLSGAAESASGLAETARERLSGAAESASGFAETARERLAGAADVARERVSEVAGTVRERAESGREAVGSRISGLLDTEEGPLSGAAHRVESARQGAVDATGTFEERIRDQPLQMLLIAGVAGFVIGRLLR
ncbi:MAG TPA: DUF2383 domain-containing protein [Longimicrobium sp.]|nr:DUF2383 domain-containing protein [Longimicrobium sp.]